MCSGAPSALDASRGGLSLLHVHVHVHVHVRVHVHVHVHVVHVHVHVLSAARRFDSLPVARARSRSTLRAAS